MDLREEKCLIAFYSRKGNNYVDGSIENLEIGNTEVIANMINDTIGGDLFRIDPVKPYPEDYEETIKVAGQELKSNARPRLRNHIADMDVYKVIFLGYPNWWGTMPMILRTFLESYDFSGKIIVPFCTHEGSELGNSVRDIEKLCPKAEVINAIPFRGGNVKNSRREVEKWIQKC
jgi:flavodoxin